jgi:hypothetical protein
VIALRRTAGKIEARFFLAARQDFFAAMMRPRAVPGETAAATVLRKRFREIATRL